MRINCERIACRALRGLRTVLLGRRPRAAWTCPGPHAVARCAGSELFVGPQTQGCADLPWATRCRPLRGLRTVLLAADPGLRGLALGYTLSPAARAQNFLLGRRPKAAWTCPGPHAVARYAGSELFVGPQTQGCADLPWATRYRPLRGLLLTSDIRSLTSDIRSLTSEF